MVRTAILAQGALSGPYFPGNQMIDNPIIMSDSHSQNPSIPPSPPSPLSPSPPSPPSINPPDSSSISLSLCKSEYSRLKSAYRCNFFKDISTPKL